MTKRIYDQIDTKVVYDIKISYMRSQIKNPVKDWFCSNTMLKSKKDSKRKKEKIKENRRFLIMNFLENRYNTIRI